MQCTRRTRIWRRSTMDISVYIVNAALFINIIMDTIIDMKCEILSSQRNANVHQHVRALFNVKVS